MNRITKKFKGVIFMKILFNFIMTALTGGFWLLWKLVKFFVKHE